MAAIGAATLTVSIVFVHVMCLIIALPITINMNITSVGRLQMLTLMFYVAATAHLSI